MIVLHTWHSLHSTPPLTHSHFWLKHSAKLMSHPPDMATRFTSNPPAKPSPPQKTPQSSYQSFSTDPSNVLQLFCYYSPPDVFLCLLHTTPQPSANQHAARNPSLRGIQFPHNGQLYTGSPCLLRSPAALVQIGNLQKGNRAPLWNESMFHHPPQYYIAEANPSLRRLRLLQRIVLRAPEPEYMAGGEPERAAGSSKGTRTENKDTR